MILDDKTAHLKAGDVAIQQATNHALLNHGMSFSMTSVGVFFGAPIPCQALAS